MSTEETQSQEKQTALVKVNSAVAGIQKISAGLAELKKKYDGVVFDVKTAKGMAEAKEARADIRAPRFEVERTRIEAKRDLIKVGKGLDALAEKITGEILAIEQPIVDQIDAEEKRREDERQAKIAAEQQRVASIQARIEAIRLMPAHAAGRASADVKVALENAGAIVIDASFAEFAQEATTALQATVQALRGIHADRMNHEAEQERIKAEREELARLRAEQAKRDAEERERIAKEAAALKAERDAETARVNEELRKQREENDRIAAENAATAKAESDRLAAERAKIEADRAVVAREQQAARDREAKAEVDRAEAKRKAEEKAAADLAAKNARRKAPPAQELIGVLAEHYKVTTAKVVQWLRSIDLEIAA